VSLLTLPSSYTGSFKAAIVNDNKVQGVKVYDARLVAIMKVYAVESVLTFNDADFKRYTATPTSRQFTR
jgi:hypothetical protein